MSFLQEINFAFLFFSLFLFHSMKCLVDNWNAVKEICVIIELTTNCNVHVITTTLTKNTKSVHKEGESFLVAP